MSTKPQQIRREAHQEIIGVLSLLVDVPIGLDGFENFCGVSFGQTLNVDEPIGFDYEELRNVLESESCVRSTRPDLIQVGVNHNTLQRV